jgi:hypothetical protein
MDVPESGLHSLGEGTDLEVGVLLGLGQPFHGQFFDALFGALLGFAEVAHDGLEFGEVLLGDRVLNLLGLFGQDMGQGFGGFLRKGGLELFVKFEGVHRRCVKRSALLELAKPIGSVSEFRDFLHRSERPRTMGQRDRGEEVEGLNS